MKIKKLISVGLAVVLSAVTLFSAGCNIENSSSFESETADTPFKMHTIDVGQGDCILLECGGEYMLIDSGEAAAENNVKDYLNSLNVKKLDYVVITHPHSDHCGGMSSVLQDFDTDTIIMPDVSHTTSVWEKLVDTIKEKDIPVKKAAAGDTYMLSSCRLTVLAPNAESYNNLNNYSVVLKAVYGDTSFLLTGDAEELSENEMTEKGFDLSADVLKVGHHGSNTSTSESFLKKVGPEYAVISDGAGNDYGHPHKEILKRLDSAGAQIYRTDLLGTIVITSDGSNISVFTKSGEISARTDQSGTEDNIDFQPDSESNASAEEESYIGNKNSKVFHNSSCKSVKKTADKNKVYFSSREEAVNNGYSPCKSCNP